MKIVRQTIILKLDNKDEVARYDNPHTFPISLIGEQILFDNNFYKIVAIGRRHRINQANTEIWEEVKIILDAHSARINEESYEIYFDNVQRTAEVWNVR